LREKQKKAEAAKSARCFPNESTALIIEGVGAVTYDTTGVAEYENSTEARSTLAITPGAQSPSRRLLAPQILLVYGFITFTDMCVQVLQPLVWSTSASLGGLGFDPYRIGLIMGIWGFMNAIVQSTCLGPIIRRIGPRNMLAAAFTSWVVILALYPFLSFFAQKAGGADATVWTILTVQLAVAMTTYGAYGTYSPVSAHSLLMSRKSAGISIIIVDHTPRESLGAANGLAQAVASGLRGVAPSVASSLFSISLERRLLGGHFVFYFLMAVALTGMRVLSFLPTPSKPQRQ
jgi:hypothetical protein